MTPDSTPIIGATKYGNLFLNTGHGTLGWTMACGSGQLVADQVCGRQPAIRADDLALSRYGAGGQAGGGVARAAQRRLSRRRAPAPVPQSGHDDRRGARPTGAS